MLVPFGPEHEFGKLTSYAWMQNLRQWVVTAARGNIIIHMVGETASPRAWRHPAARGASVTAWSREGARTLDIGDVTRNAWGRTSGSGVVHLRTTTIARVTSVLQCPCIGLNQEADSHPNHLLGIEETSVTRPPPCTLVRVRVKQA